MRFAALILLTIAAPAYAGNERTARTAQSFAAYAAKRNALNRQWAQHHARLRMDQQSAAQGHMRNPDGTLSRTWQMKTQSRAHWQQWRRDTRPRRLPITVPPATASYRRPVRY